MRRFEIGTPRVVSSAFERAILIGIRSANFIKASSHRSQPKGRTYDCTRPNVFTKRLTPIQDQTQMGRNFSDVNGLRRVELTLVFVCLVVGASVRLWVAASTPLWLDEALQWRDSLWPWINYLDWTHNRIHAPISFVFTKLSLALLGANELSLRLPSLAFGIANILLAWRLTKIVAGVREGLLVCALFALDPLLVTFDTSARMYSIWMSATIVLLAWAVKIDQTLTSGQTISLRDSLIFGLACALVFWVHPMGLYVCVATALAFLLGARTGSEMRRRFSSILVAGAVSVILSVPGLFKMLNLWLSAGNAVDLDGEENSAELVRTISGWIGTSLYPVILILSVIGLILLSVKDRAAGRYLLLLMLFGVGAVLLGQRSHFIEPKYLIPTLLAVYIGLAITTIWVLDFFVKARSPYKRQPIVFLCVTLVILGLVTRASQTLRRADSLVHAPISRFEGSRLIKHVAANSKIDDLVAFIPPYLATQADFYSLATRRMVAHLDERSWNEDFGYIGQDVWLEPGQTLWIIAETHYLKGAFENRARSAIDYLLHEAGLKEAPDSTPGEIANIISVTNGVASTTKTEELP